MINKDFKLKAKTYPFPYIVIDDFFEKEFYSKLELEFPNSKSFKTNSVNRMHGDTTFGDQLYEDLISNSITYKSLHEWVYSKKFVEYFLKFFKLDINSQKELIDDPIKFKIVPTPIEIGQVFNIENYEKNKNDPFLFPRLDLGYGKKNYGVNTGGNGPHIDNPQRLISILIYIGGYKNIAGGEHRIYEKIKNELKIFETIKPIRNRLVASLQNNEAFHGVNPVTDLIGQRNAFYLAISSTKKIWKSSKRNKLNIKYNKNRVEKSLIKKLFLKIFN